MGFTCNTLLPTSALPKPSIAVRWNLAQNVRYLRVSGMIFFPFGVILDQLSLEQLASSKKLKRYQIAFKVARNHELPSIP
jgi:hypothetical protein